MNRNSAVAPRFERTLSPAVMDRLGRMFRAMNRGMVMMWRTGLGRWAEAWPSVGGRVLIVEHHGRTSGARYLTPLNFAADDDSRYCLAAFGTGADWYRNTLAAGRIVLWLPDGRWTATASDVTDEAGARHWIRQVLIDSGFAARLAGLSPRTMTDDEIDATTASYRIVRFDIIDRCDEGYADLAWVWLPVAAGAAIIAGWGLLRRRSG